MPRKINPKSIDGLRKGTATQKRKARNRKGEFLKKANIIHEGRYDYSDIDYQNISSKIGIRCSKHGIFYQTPKKHLNRQGCPRCAKGNGGQPWGIDTFIEHARNVHGEKYDYSLTEYKNAQTPLTIICRIHGPFKQTPKHHIHAATGCPTCASKRTSSRNENLFYELLTLEYSCLTVLANDRLILNGKELDIVIPDIDLAIEWNGVYWHNSEYAKEVDKWKKEKLKHNLIQIVDPGGFDECFVFNTFKNEIDPIIKKRLRKFL